MDPVMLKSNAPTKKPKARKPEKDKTGSATTGR